MEADMIHAAADAFEGVGLEGFEPSEGTMLVRMDDPATKTKGGVIIPDRAQESRATGVVVCCPPNCLYEGRRVLIVKYAGDSVSFLGDENLRLVRYWPAEDNEVLGSWKLGC